MKKILCAMCCAGAIYAMDNVNQIELNVGNAGSHKGIVNVQATYKDADKVAAKLNLGYQKFDDKIGSDAKKTKKEDFEISVYLGRVFLDTGVTDFAGYLIGGYHFSNVSDGVNGSSKNSDGVVYGGMLEMNTIINNIFRAGASVEYKNMYSKDKNFGSGSVSLKDDKLEVLARADVIAYEGLYLGAKLGMQKRNLSIGKSEFDKSQFVFYGTFGLNY